MAITAFAVLLATSLDAWPFSTNGQGDGEGEPGGDLPAPPMGPGEEFQMGDRIEQLFASLGHGVEGGDEIAALATGDSTEPDEGITGPLDLSSALAKSLGVSDPSQSVGPIVVLHSAASSGAALRSPGVGAPASSTPTGASGEDDEEDTSGADEGGSGGGSDDDSGGDDDDGGSGDETGGDGDGGGSGDEDDGGDDDNGGDDDERPLVTVSDDGQTSNYRLDPMGGTVSFIGEDGQETAVPQIMAEKLLALFARTGRTAFEASELDEGLVLDTDVTGGAGNGGGPGTAGDDPQTAADTLIRVSEDGEFTVYRLENATGKVFVQTQGAELELPAGLAAILASLHRETGRTEFTAAELDAGLGGGDEEEDETGTPQDDREGGDNEDVGVDDGDGTPDQPADTLIEVSDEGEITLYRLETSTGKVFVQTTSGELELPPELATILSDLHHDTGRTRFTAAELDAGLGGAPGGDAEDSGSAENDEGEPDTAPADDGDAKADEGDEDEPSWFHVRIHDGDATDVFWFDAETGAGHVDERADGVPDAALDAVFAALILEMVEETGRTDFDVSELAPDDLVIDNTIGGGGSGDFDLI